MKVPQIPPPWPVALAPLFSAHATPAPDPTPAQLLEEFLATDPADAAAHEALGGTAETWFEAAALAERAGNLEAAEWLLEAAAALGL